MPEPKIRFKRADGSSYPVWHEIALCDIATRVTRKNANNETDRPLTIASIEGLVDQRTYFGKTIASKDMSGYYLLKKGEYAYNKSYSVGYDYGAIKRLDKYDWGALSTLYICFALKDAQNTEFYNCYFNSLRWYNQMPAICAEGARNHGLLNVSPADFFGIKLSVPTSLEEQQKIADFLSSVDDVIAASEEEVANLETQKKAVMKKIFSQEVRFKRDDGTDFPEWEEKMLGEVGVLRNGYAFKSGTYSKDGTYNVITIANVNGSKYIETSEKTNRIKTIPKDLAKWQLLKPGDILISLTGNVGRVSINIGKNNLLNQRVGLFELTKDIDRDFLFHVLSAPMFEKTMVDSGQGAAQKNISKSDVEDYSIPIPCLEEQRLIADFLSDFDEAIAAAKKELELWKELKKGLLQQMFV